MNQQQLQQEKIKAELDQIGAELDKLKARAKESKAEGGLKFDSYLAALEEKRDAVGKQLDSLKESGSDAIGDIKRGLKEAKERLAIAQKAAKARFH